jgi:heterodisulfide reductase subunit C
VENTQNKAFEKAAEQLRAMNREEICARCGAVKTDSGIEVSFFNETYSISLPDVTFHPSTLNLVSKLLILHYLASTGDDKTTGEYVGFRDLPGGMFYFKTYAKQGPERIARDFGDEPEKIFPIAEKLGGSKASFGDASIRLSVFPLIDVLIVLYEADNEFPTEAYVLFKNDIINYLSLKDISMLIGEVAGKLNKIKRGVFENKRDTGDATETGSNFKFEIASRLWAGFFKQCLSGSTCRVSCPVFESDEDFNPCLFIRQALSGKKEAVLSSKEFWFCMQCHTCSAQCPRGVRFSDVMAVLRQMAVEEGYVPASMLNVAEKISVISRKLRHSLTEYAWNRAKGIESGAILEKLKEHLEQGIKELE